MKQYEQILDKITPTFFKLEQYHEIVYHTLLIRDYLIAAHFPEIPVKFYIKPLINNVFLLYYITPRDFNTHLCDIKSIFLGTRDNIKVIDFWLDELIISIILNKFSFENEPLMVASHTSNFGLKPLFIALVGKDMYDTLRANIR